MSAPHLWLRAETKPMEHRAALTPSTAKTLLDAGFKITVERSDQRIFDDEEYTKVGCPLVDALSWKTDAPKDAYIVGLKELPENDDSPLSHTHIFFAHCFKNQGGWKELLHRFDAGNGTILDLEFLNDANGRRVAAFGYMAGFAGAAVGIDMWCHQKTNSGVYGALKPYPNENALIDYTKKRLAEAVALNNGVYPQVMVMGALGRCGTGACDFARKAGIPEEHIVKWDLNETKGGGPFPAILDAEIFVNCIYLNAKIPPFITREMLNGQRKLSVICDVSCDTTNPNNPIPVYSINTTFDKPTVPVETTNPLPLEVCSIDHLPTLLPRESSDMFSADLLPTILALKTREDARVWTDAEKLYQEKLAAARSA
ncbi:Saccharopine dehydrogenase [Apophysomyces sp. BC1034]|nr:Saccharopine dehydrogenase [Apophysomyces sp. BC1015]KAG0174436.1 Saccharopine dehydrogenase [Apophysomyces sp. BC1021]KAG0185823.1 Saccharopine dehydrogenase [Apophysomyces sp. BC1034]